MLTRTNDSIRDYWQDRAFIESQPKIQIFLNGKPLTKHLAKSVLRP